MYTSMATNNGATCCVYKILELVALAKLEHHENLGFAVNSGNYDLIYVSPGPTNLSEFGAKAPKNLI